MNLSSSSFSSFCSFLKCCSSKESSKNENKISEIYVNNNTVENTICNIVSTENKKESTEAIRKIEDEFSLTEEDEDEDEEVISKRIKEISLRLKSGNLPKVNSSTCENIKKSSTTKIYSKQSFHSPSRNIVSNLDFDGKNIDMAFLNINTVSQKDNKFSSSNLFTYNNESYEKFSSTMKSISTGNNNNFLTHFPINNVILDHEIHSNQKLLLQDEVGNILWNRELIIDASGLQSGLRKQRDGFTFFGSVSHYSKNIINDFVLNFGNENVFQRLFVIFFDRSVQKYYFKHYPCLNTQSIFSKYNNNQWQIIEQKFEICEGDKIKIGSNVIKFSLFP